MLLGILQVSLSYNIRRVTFGNTNGTRVKDGLSIPYDKARDASSIRVHLRLHDINLTAAMLPPDGTGIVPLIFRCQAESAATRLLHLGPQAEGAGLTMDISQIHPSRLIGPFLVCPCPPDVLVLVPNKTLHRKRAAAISIRLQ
ncbi:hypothetical protein CHU98_g4752 [Xylaria longipes]|nr:hypothetical protein CHU98_g4752 [Xylaria longipes]